MSLRTPWVRVAFVMFAVGWGANQFSPMLIVYRQALGLGPGTIAGLFAIYAATLIPGLLAGGPLSDRFGRRAVGFAAPYAVDAMNAALGRTGTFAALAGEPRRSPPGWASRPGARPLRLSPPVIPNVPS
jgi:MFS family permease